MLRSFAATQAFINSLMKLQFLTPGDADWDRCLHDARHDFYHLPSYAKLSARMDGGHAEAVSVRDGAGQLLFLPYTVRPLPSIDWLGNQAAGLFDIVSPYGYPGPLVLGDDDFLSAAIRQWSGAMRERNCVSGFIRMHPLLNKRSPAWMVGGEMVERGRTVSIDLRQSDEEIWGHFRENHRRDIVKRKRQGLVASMEEGIEVLDAFAPIYYETMDRVGATKYYYFPREYFHDLKQALGSMMSVCMIRAANGELLGGGIFTECDGIVQYHLGGTLASALQIRPSKLMFDFVCRWGKARGNHSFHLGGGFGAKEDSVYDFKAGFSPLRHPYHTWQLLFEPNAYQRLGQQRQALHRESLDVDFFPIYRAEVSDKRPSVPTQVLHNGPELVQPHDRIRDKSGLDVPKQIVVVGAGGHAKAVVGAAQFAGIEVVAVYDDDPAKWGQKLLGVPIRGPIDRILDRPMPAIIGIATASTRAALAERLNLEWATLIHPQACVHESVRIGQGTVIFSGTVVQPDVQLGEQVILNANVSVGHDCVLGDLVHLAPGVDLAGEVHIEEGAFLGIGSAVVPHVRIGAGCVVGAGAAVTANLPCYVVAVGNPAVIIKEIGGTTAPADFRPDEYLK